MILLVQMSLAFDHDIKRTPQNDDWIEDDIGYVPKDILPKFARARHPKAFRILLIENEQGLSERSD